MADHSVCWHDGMFMWPHHMQQEERLRRAELARQSKFNLHHNWGLRRLDLDVEALKKGRLVIRRLQARLSHGTLVDLPDDASLDVPDLVKELDAQDPLTVYVAVPLLRPTEVDADEAAAASGVSAEPAAQDNRPGSEVRFSTELTEVYDENTGGDRQQITMRRLRVKLLLGSDPAQTGYEKLPILQVQKNSGPEGPLRLDDTYIPPLLACDAWEPLAKGILQAVYHRIGAHVDRLAKQVGKWRITFETTNPGDAIMLAQLTALNEAYALLNVIAFAEGIHPLQAYCELCRLVGELSIFQHERRVPDLPNYDHDRLGYCFSRVKQYFDAFELGPQGCEEEPFVGDALRLQVPLKSHWLGATYEMYVGVYSPALKSDEVVRVLTRGGQLKMKIGSAAQVDRIFERGDAGLQFKPVDRPTRDLPVIADQTYFEIQRDARRDEWANVQKDLKLAIRLNQHHLVLNEQGNIQGQTEVKIKLAKGDPVPMRFVLYLVPTRA
ncbi:MAG: type VI secretion system baseplate subunit TssK [Gemmataceae bacterium]|nr:type VI secretion system baseplate subunit TssK [Gemmataceae bacterium]